MYLLYNIVTTYYNTLFSPMAGMRATCKRWCKDGGVWVGPCEWDGRGRGVRAVWSRAAAWWVIEGQAVLLRAAAVH